MKLRVFLTYVSMFLVMYQTLTLAGDTVVSDEEEGKASEQPEQSGNKTIPGYERDPETGLPNMPDPEKVHGLYVPVNDTSEDPKGKVKYQFVPLPPIENYHNSNRTQHIRNMLAKKTDNKFHMTYDVRLKNLIELSGEMYDYYMVDRYKGEFVVKNNTNYIIIFIRKQDHKSFLFAEHLHNITDQIKELGNYKLAYVDESLDPEMTATFDTRQTPHVFMMDGEDGMVYSWDYYLDPTNFTQWLKTKQYKDSPYQFKAPSRYTTKKMFAYHRYMQLKFAYLMYVGKIVEYVAHVYCKPVLKFPPFNMIFDHNGSDQFGFKVDNQFLTAIVTALIMLALLTRFITRICRRSFCLKKKYVLVKKKNA